MKLINSIEMMRWEFSIAKRYSTSYTNKLRTISKYSTPFVLKCYILQQCSKQGFELRDRYLDFEALSIIEYLGLNNFKRASVNAGLFNPVRIATSVKYLVSKGYLKNDNGTYRTTEHYEAFWDCFKIEYRKALKKFSNVERIGKRRKKLRK